MFLPVLVSPYAGANGELLRDGENSFICPLDAGVWAERAVRLLVQPALQEAFSARSLELVRQYTFDNAAQGLLDACHAALAVRPGRPAPFPRAASPIARAKAGKREAENS